MMEIDPTDATLIDKLLAEQTRRWQSGEHVLVEDYLPQNAEVQADPAKLLDLIYNEIWLREQSGAEPNLHEYVRRFPHLATPLRRQFEVHRALMESRSEIEPETPTGLQTLAEPAKRDFPTLALDDGGLAVPPSEWQMLLAPAQNSEELGRLGPYSVLRVLGMGGMGIVFQARDTVLGRAVALKVMRLSAADGARSRQRFLREAQIAASVEHDHIVPIYQVGEDRGVPFLAMQMLQGESLDHRLKREKQLPIAEALRIGREVAQGLTAAHERGLIHRDIKPANLWLEAGSGRVKILDFGLARSENDAEQLTRSGALIGTPAYMAPEQIDPKMGNAGPPSDLYALGVVLFRMLTGRLPFEGATITLLRQIVDEEIPPPSRFRPDLDPALEALTLKAMARRPEDRFADARALAMALACYPQVSAPAETAALAAPSVRRERNSADSDCTTTFDGLPTEGTPSRPRRRIALAVTALTVLAIGAVTLVAIAPWQRPHANPEKVIPKEEGPTLTPLPVAYRGYIDVQVTEKGNPRRQLVWLRDPAARPLKLEDEVRVEARLNVPAYLYILWIDTTGKALPIYPWREGNWEQRPSQEPKVERLSLPPQLGQVWTIAAGPAGMETLVLLARSTPLPGDVLLNQVLGQVEVPPLDDTRDVAWFDNGAPRKNDPDRGPNLKNSVDASNPIVRQQAQLWEKLRPHFSYMTTVTFANLGK